MNRSFAALPLAMCFCLLCSCSSTPKLTKQAAYQEIAKSHIPGQEILYFEKIPEDSPLGRNVRELIDGNYFTWSSSVPAAETYVLPGNTARDTGILMYYRYGKYYKIQVPVARTKVGNVIDITDDSGNDMAVALYSVVLEPIEPYYSKLCIDPACGYYGDRLKKTSRKNKNFRYFNNSWKMVP